MDYDNWSTSYDRFLSLSQIWETVKWLPSECFILKFENRSFKEIVYYRAKNLSQKFVINYLREFEQVI